MPFDASISGEWPYVPVLGRLLLALGLGVFVGMERERRGKEAGIRTFGFVALLGCLGSLSGETFALIALALVGILVVFLNVQRLRTNETAELTTSAALFTVGFAGVLCGRGHTFTPVAVGVGAASLLAWKEKLSDFSVGLTEKELRAAILLGIIAFVVYPALPSQPLDPWGLVEPRTAWATVILIAGIGFVNYVLWKVYGARGMLLSSFLGGLVNSTIAVSELAARTRDVGPAMVTTAYRGVITANGAMLLRNSVLVGLLSAATLPYVAAPLAVMMGVTAILLWLDHRKLSEEGAAPALSIQSPFSLMSALKFGAVFVALDAGGALAQRYLGQFGFYAVSFFGGIVSSSSAVASAAALARKGELPVHVAANGVIVAVVASLFTDPPLVWKVVNFRVLTIRVTKSLSIVAACGLAAVLVQALLLSRR